MGLVFVVVVSEIMIYSKISQDKIQDQNFWIRFISTLQNKLSHLDSLDNKVLVVKLEHITNDDNTMIPKLEHKKT